MGFKLEYVKSTKRYNYLKKKEKIKQYLLVMEFTI